MVALLSGKNPKIIHLYPGLDDRCVVYEFPLSERFRLFLRLHALFRNFYHYLESPSPFESQVALEVLFDIVLLLKGNDLRQELLEEFNRLKKGLRALFKALEGEEKTYETLQKTYEKTVRLEQALLQRKKITFPELESGWLADFNYRRHLPAATLSFDLPAFHRWLMFSPERRQRDLHRWIAPALPLWEALDHLLSLLRDSQEPKRRVARKGLFQESLTEVRDRCRLVRVLVDSKFDGHLEILANRSRLMGRFLRQYGGEMVQVEEDIPFSLVLCGL